MNLIVGDTRPIVANVGMGVDSGAWILDALDDPAIRGRIAAVMIAQTGHEWPDTKQFMEEIVFPRLRKYNILTIQAARAGKFKRDGVKTLDWTMHPEVCFTRPTKEMPYFTLGREMGLGGTFPAVSGARKCSVRAKGNVLDPLRDELMGSRPYLHMMGFEAGETSRAVKDAKENTATRTGWYPLIEQGLDRGACGDIIQDKCGEAGSKSACSFCPFALTNKEGRARTVERFKAMPKEALIPLIIEDTGVRMNPAMGGLAGGKRLRDILIAGGAEDVVKPVDAELDKTRWGLYEVRRVLKRQANAMRSVRKLSTGTRAAMEAELSNHSSLGRGQLKEASDGIARLWTLERGESYPMRERFLVAAPVLAVDKERPGFAKAWREAA